MEIARSLLVVALALLPTTSSWRAAPAVALRPRGVAAASHALRARAPLLAADDDEGITWEFGDAATEGVSDLTAQAIAVEEKELSEKEKEIARLKAAEKFMMRDTGDAKCTVCNYMYRWEEGAPPQLPKKTPWAYVPDSFTCPKCKSPKAFFEPDQIEIAGFADNQAYGFGTNTWTESQKSGAIFGGLAAFFALLLGGYALN